MKKEERSVRRLASRILRFKLLVVAIVCGVLISLATGLVENPPEASIIGAKYYGYPLVWRVVIISLTTSVDFRFISLAVDMVFWIVFSFLALIFTEKIVLPRLGAGFDFRRLVLPLVLFVPLGLVTDFVHEFGHAVWGIAVGGHLKYMQIAYLVVYPRLAVTPSFLLGYVEVADLSTPFAHGVFLLGGSLTTNIVSWLLALILLKKQFGDRTQVSLKILGFFGLLDLPLYVVFPQIGLQHWIFLGGNWPEPLTGAREMGIPDPLFYTAVILSTIGLVLLYHRPLRQMVRKRFAEIKTLGKQKKGGVASQLQTGLRSCRLGDFALHQHVYTRNAGRST